MTAPSRGSHTTPLAIVRRADTVAPVATPPAHLFQFQPTHGSTLDFSAVEVRVSGVEGRGVYAARALPAGAFVAPLTGTLVPSHVAEAPGYARMALQIDDDWWLEELGFADDFINHSCEPNLRFSAAGDALEAARDIRAGEELFFDYATSLYDGGWRVACRCGSAHCRGFITGFEDLAPELRQKLLASCLPYIRRKGESSPEAVAMTGTTASRRSPPPPA